jgi:DNA-directed RNA polymerase subunit K/omega
MDMAPEEIGIAGGAHNQPQEGLFAVGGGDTSGGFSPGYTPASPDGSDPWSPLSPGAVIEEDQGEEDASVAGPTDPMKDYETKKKAYKTTPVLTKYERTRILGQRSNQILNGSKPLIHNPEDYQNAYEIALQELEQKKIPFIIKRPYGNTFEYWKLDDLH